MIGASGGASRTPRIDRTPLFQLILGVRLLLRMLVMTYLVVERCSLPAIRQRVLEHRLAGPATRAFWSKRSASQPQVALAANRPKLAHVARFQALVF